MLLTGVYVSNVDFSLYSCGCAHSERIAGIPRPLKYPTGETPILLPLIFINLTTDVHKTLKGQIFGICIRNSSFSKEPHKARAKRLKKHPERFGLALRQSHGENFRLA